MPKDDVILDSLENFAFLVKVLAPILMFLIGASFAFMGHTGILINKENEKLANLGNAIMFGGGLGTGMVSRKQN